MPGCESQKERVADRLEGSGVAKRVLGGFLDNRVLLVGSIGY